MPRGKYPRKRKAAHKPRIGNDVFAVENGQVKSRRRTLAQQIQSLNAHIVNLENQNRVLGQDNRDLDRRIGVLTNRMQDLKIAASNMADAVSHLVKLP